MAPPRESSQTLFFQQGAVMMNIWVIFAVAIALGGSAEALSLSNSFQQTFPGTFPQQFYTEAIPAAHSQAQLAGNTAIASQQSFFHNHQFDHSSGNAAFGSNDFLPAQAHQLAHSDFHQQPFFNNLQDENFAVRSSFQTNPLAFSSQSVANPTPFVPSQTSFVPTQAPVVPTRAPVVPIDNQYQAIDEYGQYTFGFSGGDLARTETRDAFGNVRGSYDYIDSEGNLQTQHYIADQNGFRVVGTNLPRIPEVVKAVPSAPQVARAKVVRVKLPNPVTDTPEVAAAKAAFAKAYNKAALAAAEAPDID